VKTKTADDLAGKCYEVLNACREPMNALEIRAALSGIPDPSEVYRACHSDNRIEGFIAPGRTLMLFRVKP
jgi:hypothetical protein